MPWRGKVSPKGWMSVRAAITVLVRNKSLRVILSDCISFSGDVDTVAAIAMAAGSCCSEIAQDRPENLVWLLENGTYGRDYLIESDQELLSFARTG